MAIQDNKGEKVIPIRVLETGKKILGSIYKWCSSKKEKRKADLAGEKPF